MWTHKEREDRYYNSEWVPNTNRTMQDRYGKEWFKKYGIDTRGFLIRDLVYITASQPIIKKASWKQFCIAPLTNIDNNQLVKDGFNVESVTSKYIREYWISIFNKLCNGEKTDRYVENKDVIEIYKNLFPNINKTFEGRWSSEYSKIRSINQKDLHPTPKEALGFIDNVWPENTLSNSARHCVDEWEDLRLNVDRL